MWRETARLEPQPCIRMEVDMPRVTFLGNRQDMCMCSLAIVMILMVVWVGLWIGIGARAWRCLQSLIEGQ